MIKIQSFGTKSRLKNNESLTFGREIEAKVLQGVPSALNVVDVFNAYQDALLTFDDSIVDIGKSPITAQMQDVDATRNYMYSGINEQIRIATRHFDMTKKAAATRLMLVVNTYTGGQNRGYTDQTGFTYNFIQALTSDTYKTDVEVLGLTEWVTNLKKANDLCAQLDSQRTAEKATKAPKGSTVSARSTYEHAYDALVERLNALALVNGETAYVDLFAWWNACVDRYRIVISNNLGAGKGGATGGGSSKPSKPTGDKPDENPDDL